jgi:glycine/D-amino acid oxidase-like deaminating enzyme
VFPASVHVNPQLTVMGMAPRYRPIVPAMHAVIVGAGTFGASLAWWLARAGRRVTLVDQFEPGDRRATSGGETRLIRCSHGDDADYPAMARRARTLWRELEAESGADLLVECGVAWFAHGEDGWEAASQRTMVAQGIPAVRLDVAAAARMFPSLRGDDLAFVLLEPEAGVLRAQRAVRALAAQAAAYGARIVRGRATPDGGAAVLDDGTRLEGDVVVWACGGWLTRLFAGLVSLHVTRQELLFLDGGEAWRASGVPAWVDYDHAMYGTADLDGLGVKAALDVEGPPLDPDADLDDTPTTEPAVRAYLRRRFPDLEPAPLVEARACRYELTPDSHFLAASHPAHERVWLVGGGSGHGFKHGPAMAERLAAALRGGAPLPDRFSLGERAPARSLRTAGSGVVGYGASSAAD